MTTGGRGITEERAKIARLAGLDSASVSIDGLEATHDRLRGVPGSFRAALDAMRHFREAGVRVACNTQINRLSVPQLPELLETIAGAGVHSWQIQLTVPMGRAADEPDVLLQPYDLLDVFPLLGRLKERCKELGVRLWPGNNIGYFGPYESALQGDDAARSHVIVRRRALHARHRGRRRDQRVPVASHRGVDRRQHSRSLAPRDLGALGAASLHARSHGRRSVGVLSKLLLRRRMPRGLHVDDRSCCSEKPGNNPYCHHRALEMQRAGKRERVAQVGLPPGAPFDYGHFELIIEDEPTLEAVP